MSDDTNPLVFHTFPAALGLPISESPPCAKVEVYLKLTKTPYTEVVGDTRKSPTGLIPFVQWPNGEFQAESGDIIARLEEKYHIDDNIDSTRLAHGKQVQILAEEIIYDASLYDRFVVPEGAKKQRPLTKTLLARLLPSFVVPLAAYYIDWRQVRRAKRTRMADPEKGYAAAIDALEQIVALLGDDPFLCGTQPCTVDCSVWPLVIHAAAFPIQTPLSRAVSTYPTLVDYVVRFGEHLNSPVTANQIQA